MPESVYIHIPFCKSKCKYCSFISFENQEKKLGYLYSLLKEIEYYYKGENLNTLYIGGGTPSVLSIDELKKIISKFNFSQNPEITIEINPNDASLEYLSGLKSLGFNRLSMGAQSFNDTILKLIGRRHNSQEIYNAVNLAQKVNFENISLDLIYGLPNQTINDFEYDLNQLIELDIQHISLYGLKIEEGCYFYTHLPQNLPNDDIQADMYLLANKITKQHNFEHYEISNYSKPNYNSRHNTNYWKCGQYYGFGISAHGYDGNIRYSNYSTLDEYLNSPISHEYGTFLTDEIKLEERIFLGLRLAEGIDTNKINKDFHIDFDKKYKAQIEKYILSGHLIKTNNGYRLSNDEKSNGFLISNLILSDFITSE